MKLYVFVTTINVVVAAAAAPLLQHPPPWFAVIDKIVSDFVQPQLEQDSNDNNNNIEYKHQITAIREKPNNRIAELGWEIVANATFN